jgi:hypothetical protein
LEVKISNCTVLREDNVLTHAARAAVLYHKMNIKTIDLIRELVDAGYTETERAVVYSALLALELYDETLKPRTVKQVVKGWFRIR